MHVSGSLRVTPFVLGIVLAAAAPAGRVASAAPAPAAVRIGTFDSRAVALAYYRSPDGQAEATALRAEYQKAKAAGDKEKIAELEVRGPAMQMLMHQQAFSNGSIGNIVPLFAPKLAGIAKAAGVVAIVSKWEVTHAAANVELVDVTPQVVALFAPDAATKQILEGMKGQNPIGLLEALMIKD